MSSRLTIERALAAADPNAISTVTPRCALVLGPVIVRRSRGFAPAVVATLPVTAPVLAVGGGLKKAVVLVVEGQACASQHVGDLSHADARRAFEQTVHDLLAVTRSITFDGQASTWLEELARSAGSDAASSRGVSRGRRSTGVSCSCSWSRRDSAASGSRRSQGISSRVCAGNRRRGDRARRQC